MNKLLLPLLFLSLLGLGTAFSSPTHELTADEHPSEASRIWARYSPTDVASSPGTRADAAAAFLASLNDEQRRACALELDDPERGKWTNVPSSSSDGGVRLGDLDAEQQGLACELMARVLSGAGYQKLRDIMLADDRLLRDGKPREGFGTEEYRLVLFGSPAPDGVWALQFDGHHIGLNLAFDGAALTMSPSFIGTQPAAFAIDGRQVVPLAGEVDDAFALINALTDAQRAEAIVSATRGRLASGPGTDGEVPEPVGFSCAALDGEQRSILMRLIGHYVGVLPEPAASTRLASLEQEIDRMRFAWSGPTDNPSDVSYRLQSDTLLIEYACQNLGGNPLDHLHSMFRDPTNEYGAGF